MAYTLQLVDARNDLGIRNIAGVCNNSTQFADYVNRATRRLMKRGAWFGAECLLRLCTTGCDCVFPRHVGTVLGLRLCRSGQMQIRNSWWEIVAPGCGGWSNGGSGWGYGGVYGGGYWGGSYAIDMNNVPIFNQVSGNTGKLIRYHTVSAQDLGKTITLFGKKYGGQPLQEQVDGVTQNGLTIVAATPTAQTTTLVTKIDSVVREATVSPAWLYEYDTATAKLRMLASYEPGETNPSYRHMKIPALSGAGCSVDENGQRTYQFEALVKLAYIPVVSDNDFLLLDNLDALALGISALKAEEANDDNLAEIKWTKAIQDLNFELRDKSPSDQLTVKVSVGRCLVSPY